MILSKSNISDFSKWRLTKLSNLVSEFCRVNLGWKKSRGVPNIKLSYRRVGKCYGAYDPFSNTIIIYVFELKTLGDFTSTIIHEWTHSNQNIIRSYVKLYKKFGYDNHPMEIEAVCNEKKWNRKCLAFLRKK